jgi:hypothetical protein
LFTCAKRSSPIREVSFARGSANQENVSTQSLRVSWLQQTNRRCPSSTSGMTTWTVNRSPRMVILSPNRGSKPYAVLLILHNLNHIPLASKACACHLSTALKKFISRGIRNPRISWKSPCGTFTHSQCQDVKIPSALSFPGSFGQPSRRLQTVARSNFQFSRACSICPTGRGK